MAKLKITIEDAKAELRDAATGPHSQHWSYSPAIMALLNNHDELLAILGEATAALEEARTGCIEVPSTVIGARERDELRRRAEAAEQREEHLKADAAVMGQRIAELEVTQMTAPPAPAVPDAKPEIDYGEGGSDIDYMQPQEIYDMGKVDGWNACRAARIRLSGSSEQKGKRLRIAEGKFAAYFPQERPLSGARVIAWDENGNLLGVGFGLDTRQTGIAIIINGKKYDSNHVIHWCNSPVVPDGCGTIPNGQPAAHVSLESFSSDGTSDIMTKNLPVGTALFTAPPMPSVTHDLLDAMTEIIRISDRDHDAWNRAKIAISICRAAIPATAPDEIDKFVDQVCGNLPAGHQQ